MFVNFITTQFLPHAHLQYHPTQYMTNSEMKCSILFEHNIEFSILYEHDNELSILFKETLYYLIIFLKSRFSVFMCLLCNRSIWEEWHIKAITKVTSYLNKQTKTEHLSIQTDDLKGNYYTTPWIKQ